MEDETNMTDGTEDAFAASKPEGFKSGFVTLLGRPNAGKSTLLNACMGEKVAITSSTPQTTRNRLRAVLDLPDAQVVLVDTPGLHKPHDMLGEELNESAMKALQDVDVIAMVVDASKPVGKGDEWVGRQLAASSAHKVLVISKCDLASPREVELQKTRAQRLAHFDAIVAVSALKGFNIEGFIDAVADLLPEGPRWFPEGMGTDQPIEVLVSEFIREKVLRMTHDEIPYSIGVQVDDLEYDESRELYRVFATIYTERESQKGIVIGHGGQMIKKIGTEARADLIRLLGGSVHLDLKVKVKKNWRRDITQIRRFGYGEGE